MAGKDEGSDDYGSCGGQVMKRYVPAIERYLLRGSDRDAELRRARARQSRELLRKQHPEATAILDAIGRQSVK
jgi:hypothetical protein